MKARRGRKTGSRERRRCGGKAGEEHGAKGARTKERGAEGQGRDHGDRAGREGEGRVQGALQHSDRSITAGGALCQASVALRH